MPSVTDRMQQLSSEELREFPTVGPFGGIQSELPLSLIEDYGFADTQNICFRMGEAQHRPSYVPLPAIPALGFGEYVTTFAAFYDSLGLQQQVIFTNNGNLRPLKWDGAAFSNIAGPVLPLVSSILPVAVSVLKQELCFSMGGPFNGVQVYLYDPQAAPGVFTLSSANSPKALSLAEINLHLMTSNILVPGPGLAAQRYQWSGAGDPTDWVSFNAGLSDQFVDLGPAFGLQKLGQFGFGYHPKGIIQVIPTGNGIAPFAFIPINTGGIGLVKALYSLQKISLGGTDCSIFAAQDNIYLFNQTTLDAIGDAPIGQRRRLGARSRIMADIALSGLNNTRSWVTAAPGGSPFLAYYLLCSKSNTDPTLCPLWVYNFDEANWTRWIFNKVPRAIGDFVLNPGSAAPVDTKIGIGFIDGSVGYLDFNNSGSETSSIITSGKLILGDRRHKKTVTKFRIVFTDKGPVTFTITVTNESGVSDQDSITLGTGSGDNLTAVLSVKVTGLRFQYTLTAPANSKFGVVELTPLYDIGGEQRGGTADGN